MAVQVGGRYPSRAAKAQQAAKAKEKRQKVFLGIGGALLLIILAIQLPKLMHGSGGGAASAPPAATPVQPTASATPSGAAVAKPAAIPGLAGLRHLSPKDPFVPQVNASPSGTGTAASSGPSIRTAKGPAVKAKDFIAKDPFVAQIATPSSATPAATSAAATAVKTPSSASAGGAASGAGLIVVIASTSGKSGKAEANRDLVAAQNLGLKDVNVARIQTPRGGTPPFTVYTGPYLTQAGAQQELVRALRVGYTGAYTRNLPKAGE